MEMKNIFKRIWNFFRPEKKKAEVKDYGCQPISVPTLEDCGEPIIQSKCIEQKVEQPKPQTQIFRNQQLSGKIYNIGKCRFRINKKLTETADGRLKYIITKLI